MMGGFKSRDLLRNVRRSLTTGLPCLNLLLQHLRALHPRTDRVPYNTVELFGPHALGRASACAPRIDGCAMQASVVEVFVPLARAALSYARHPPAAVSACHERAQEIIVMRVARRPALVLR